MSRDRDRARVALEFLGEWFGKSIEPHLVAFGLMSIDPALLPIASASEIDDAIKEMIGLARPGPITTPEARAWLRQVLEEGLATKAQMAEIDQAVEDVGDLDIGPQSVEELRAARSDYAARRMDHYDCLDVGGENFMVHGTTARLFGNGNLHIGMLELTSMQVGSYLDSDQSALIDHWYARTDARGADREALEQWAEGALVMLVIGDHPMWIRPLSVLLRERPWVPPARRGEVLTPEEMAQFEAAREEGAAPAFVPIRQNMNIDVTLPAAPPPVKARVWIHVEGLTLRPIQ